MERLYPRATNGNTDWMRFSVSNKDTLWQFITIGVVCKFGIYSQL